MNDEQAQTKPDHPLKGRKRSREAVKKMIATKRAQREAKREKHSIPLHLLKPKSRRKKKPASFPAISPRLAEATRNNRLDLAVKLAEAIVLLLK